MKEKINKLKELKINWIHLLLGLLILGLVLLSYSYVGEIDTTQSSIEENNSISIFGWELNLGTTSLLFASIVIGLLDGFNPCAMWVLVYLISLATSIGDKRKMYIIVGLFVAVEAIMYFIVLAGWLTIFETLNLASLDIVIKIVGAFAIYTGIMSAYSYYKSGGLVECEVGDLDTKKKTMDRINSIVKSPITIASLIAVVVLAVIVNAFEFLCSAGLPAVFTQLLVVSNVSVAAKYFYIFVYDFFFMIDDFIVFGLAIWAFNSDWMTKYSGYSKLLGGIIMVIIGIYLLFPTIF